MKSKFRGEILNEFMKDKEVRIYLFGFYALLSVGVALSHPAVRAFIFWVHTIIAIYLKYQNIFAFYSVFCIIIIWIIRKQYENTFTVRAFFWFCKFKITKLLGKSFKIQQWTFGVEGKNWK